MPIPFWVAQLLGGIAASALSNAAKAGARRAVSNAAKKGAGGLAQALGNASVKKAVTENIGKTVGRAAGMFAAGAAGSAVGNAGSLMPVGTNVGDMLFRLGRAGESQFLDSATLLFLQRYVLPKMFGGGVFNDDGTFNPLELINAVKRYEDGQKAVKWAFENRDRLGPYPWLPAVRKGAGLPARILGWGGREAGGWNVDDLLNRIYDDPLDYWEKQVSPDGTRAIGEDPFAKQTAERDWLRAQRRKDAEFDEETRRKIDEDRQEWIDKKMEIYKKPMGQWWKEKVPELAGTLLGTAGESLDLYNSILANALMQSAASAMTPLQEELYGNPYKRAAALYGGGRMAAGKVADSVGKNLGGFLRDWSDDIRAEFERQRITRLQYDNPQPGRVVETLGDVRASDARYRDNWVRRNARGGRSGRKDYWY